MRPPPLLARVPPRVEESEEDEVDEEKAEEDKRGEEEMAEEDEMPAEAEEVLGGALTPLKPAGDVSELADVVSPHEAELTDVALPRGTAG